MRGTAVVCGGVRGAGAGLLVSREAAKPRRELYWGGDVGVRGKRNEERGAGNCVRRAADGSPRVRVCGSAGLCFW